MKSGDGFQRDGSYWYATEVIEEHNEEFRWLKVKARWCGYGPRPLWANDVHKFHMERTRISTGERMA